MDRFVTRNEKKTGDSAPAEKTKTDSTPNHQKGQPKRKYDEAYLALGFTAGVVGADERPVCVLCLKTLAADSMRPNKLRRHLETKHPKHMNKPLDFFQRKLGVSSTGKSNDMCHTLRETSIWSAVEESPWGLYSELPDLSFVWGNPLFRPKNVGAVGYNVSTINEEVGTIHQKK